LHGVSKPLIVLLRITAVALAFWQAWCYRFTTFQGDCIAYFDMARAAMHGDFGTLIHPTWCSLYPALLAAVWTLAQPSDKWLWFSSHLINALIFVLALFTFEYFLRGLLANRRNLAGGTRLPLSAKSLWIGGYVVFLGVLLGMQGVYLDTPDMLTHAITFSIAGLLLWRISKHELRRAELLGIACGIGFLAKSVFLALAVVVGICIALSARRAKLRQLVSFAICFGIFALPYTLALSMKEGHLTTGEVPKIAYFTYGTLQYDFMYPSGPDLRHPPRKIFEQPDAYVFDVMPSATYPIWFNRAYWFEGSRLKLNWVSHLALLLVNARVFIVQFAGALIAAVAIGSLRARQSVISARSLGLAAGPLLLALAGLTIYLNATLMNYAWAVRYYAAFAVILTCVLMSALKDKLSFTIIVLFFASQLALSAITDYQHGLSQTPDDLKIATSLNQQGFRHARLAQIIQRYQIKDPFSARNQGWAYLAKARLIADIDDPEVFWKAPEPRRRELYDYLRAEGISAIILEPGKVPPIDQRTEWTRIDDSSAFIHPL
jgi:hypothetical protein